MLDVTLWATREWAVPDDLDIDPIDSEVCTPQQLLTYVLGQKLQSEIVPSVMDFIDEPVVPSRVFVHYRSYHAHDHNVPPLSIIVATVRTKRLVRLRTEIRRALHEAIAVFDGRRLGSCNLPDFDVGVIFVEGAGMSIQSGRITGPWKSTE